MNSLHLSVRNTVNANNVGTVNTDSLVVGNESGRINDFVIQRESMTFKKVPSFSQVNQFDKSPAHSQNENGTIDFRNQHGGSQLVDQPDSLGI